MEARPADAPPGEDPAATADAAKGATALLLSAIDRLERRSASPLQSFETNVDGDARSSPEAAASDEPTATLGMVFEELEERGFGLLLLLLALPCCLPFVYLLPQIVAVPMLLLSVQMASGRHSPWLPGNLKNRSVPLAALRNVVERAGRYVGWIERLAHPRLLPLTSHGASRVLGALLAIPCASILVPLPSTNTVPGIGVAIASVGLIERDGLLVLLGLAIGLAWVALLVIGGPAFLFWAREAIFG
ncbi:MAG: exopolysaccharide biosynthesis protein [Pseudomonadota bacterium]